MKRYPYNEDTGDINDIKNIDFLVVGLSKCGTTTLQFALDRVGRCLKYHSNYTLERVYDAEVTTKSILEQIDYPTIFTLYREPLSRKISQYYYYQFKGSLKDFCLGDYTTFDESYRTEVDEDMVYEQIAEATGIDVLAYYFNKELGYTIIGNDNITLVPCTLENIDTLAGFFKLDLVSKRVSNRGRPKLEFSDAELDEIYSSEYCQHFYTKKQLKKFKLWAKG